MVIFNLSYKFNIYKEETRRHYFIFGTVAKLVKAIRLDRMYFAGSTPVSAKIILLLRSSAGSSNALLKRWSQVRIPPKQFV